MRYNFYDSISIQPIHSVILQNTFVAQAELESQREMLKLQKEIEKYEKREAPVKCNRKRKEKTSTDEPIEQVVRPPRPNNTGNDRKRKLFNVNSNFLDF